MRDAKAYRIGELSRHTSVSIETIRYYERAGLLPKAVRTTGGYRTYGSADAQRVSFIKRARSLGFSLDEVRRLLDLADQNSRSCRAVHALASRHLEDIKAKIVDLENMEKVLAVMVAECAQGTMPDCPLLETLARR